MLFFDSSRQNVMANFWIIFTWCHKFSNVAVVPVRWRASSRNQLDELFALPPSNVRSASKTTKGETHNKNAPLLKRSHEANGWDKSAFFSLVHRNFQYRLFLGILNCTSSNQKCCRYSPFHEADRLVYETLSARLVIFLHGDDVRQRFGRIVLTMFERIIWV